MKNNTSMGITKIPMSTNGFHGVSLKIEKVIDNIEQKVKQAIPYVNPAKVFVELERDRVSDLYKNCATIY
jgi:hypothetical protein